MRTVRQLFRQALKTIAGVIVVALATAILAVGTGQAITALRTREAMEYQFNTAALFTPEHSAIDSFATSFASIGSSGGAIRRFSTLPEVKAWTDDLIAQNPHIVRLDSRPGLASAYISCLIVDNQTQHDFHTPLALSVVENAASSIPAPLGAPYCSALLTIEITSAEQKMVQSIEPGSTEMVPSRQWNLTGIIREVHALQEGYNDPAGWSVQISLLLKRSEVGIVDPARFVGKQVLAYTTSYYDADWELREQIKMEYANRAYGAEDVIIDAFDPEKLIPLTEKEIEQNKASKPYHYDVAEYLHEYKRIGLTEREVSAFRSVWMTNPKLMLLEGSAEDFLTSEEGIQWAKYLEYAEINAHAFPMIGVDKLGYIGAFAQESARVVEGRDFTQEELDNGAKVCVMAQSLAAANGLAVGDTINPRYYNFDPEAEGQYLVSDGWGTTNPAAYFYGENTPWAGETEEYTIVGLYRYDSEWGDPQEDLYSFTPNTIFVPKNSVTGTMDYGDQAFFRTIVLENGKIEEFSQLVNDAGYEGLFVYYDQGYSEVIDTFYDYESSAKRVAVIGGAVYGVLLLLFLLLFPVRHGKVLATMSSLGAPRGKKYTYVAGSTLALLIPGTVIGTAAGLLLWRRVSAALLESAEVVLDVELNAGVLLLAAAAQFLFALCLVLIIAIPASRGNSLMKRK